VSITRAGGGGGGGSSSTGGLGGGGGGTSAQSTSQGGNGLVNTGSGGGGAGYNFSQNVRGGNGGSGVVILRYPNSRTIAIGAGLVADTPILVGSDTVVRITSGIVNVPFTKSILLPSKNPSSSALI
jgi:hypothetical protein